MAQQQQQQQDAEGGGGSPLYLLDTLIDDGTTGFKTLRIEIQPEFTPRRLYIGDDIHRYLSQISAVHSSLMEDPKPEREKVKTLLISRWDHLDDRRHYIDVLPICKTVKSCLPCLEKLTIEWANRWTDRNLTMLLEHLPSTFLSLELNMAMRPIPLFFQQIPQSFPKLKELNLKYCVAAYGGFHWPTACFALLGNTLRAMPTLQKLTMDCVVCQSATDWDPVLEAIYDHPNLVNLQLECLQQPHLNSTFRFGTEIEEKLLSHLRIRRFMKENVFVRDCIMTMDNIDDGGNCALKPWVEAVVAARHHVDCLDHLFSNFDPTIFANAAMKGLSGPCQRRARWMETTNEGRVQREAELIREQAEAEQAALRRNREREEVFDEIEEEEDDSDNDSDEETGEESDNNVDDDRPRANQDDGGDDEDGEVEEVEEKDGEEMTPGDGQDDADDGRDWS